MLRNDPLKLKTKFITTGMPGDGQITCVYYLSWEALTFFLFDNNLKKGYEFLLRLSSSLPSLCIHYSAILSI